MSDLPEVTTLAEIAKALCIAKQNVHDRSLKEKWPFTEERCRGGRRRLYCVNELPYVIAQAVFNYRALREINSINGDGETFGRRLRLRDDLDKALRRKRAEHSLAHLTFLPQTYRDRAEVKNGILARFKTFHRESRMTTVAAQYAFAEAYNAGQIEVDELTRRLVPKLSRSALHTWEMLIKEEGPGRVAGKYGNRSGTGWFATHEKGRQFIVGFYRDHPDASIANVIDGLRARFLNEKLPADRTLQRDISRFRSQYKQLLTAVSNPDKWRSHYQAASGNASEQVVRLNQIWEADSTVGDVMLADGKRHAIIGIIDVYTRRLKFYVSRTSRAAAIAAALRRALLDWGVPEQLKTDNGSDYVSKHIAAVCNGLSIEHVVCPPFSPDRKPHIERALGTFLHGLVELLPGYIGHSVAERKDIEARKSFAQRMMGGGEPPKLTMSAEDLQEICDRWTDEVYAHDPHGGLYGKRPFQMATNWKGAVTVIEDEKALDVLLGEPAGWRIVGKKGIRIDGGIFDHPLLGGHEGEDVYCVRKDEDAGVMYVWDRDMGFLCIAVDPLRAGVSRSEIASQRRAIQRRVIAEGKKWMNEQAKGANTADIAREILRTRGDISRRVIAFPPTTKPHDAPALQEAARASSADAPPAGLNPEHQAEIDAFIERMEAKVEEIRDVRAVTQQPQYMCAYWLWCNEQIKAGKPLSDLDVKFHASYPSTAGYKFGMMMLRDWADLDFRDYLPQWTKERPVEPAINEQ